jgi:tRNA pseudouridine55 synthase
VVQQVRRALGERRVGHTGTLDPAATGVLVLCVGRATRLVQFLQAGTKIYAARLVLGITTESQDADGEVVARTPAGHVDERMLCEALSAFQGEIDQVPPMVSAVRVDGERLHHKARRGETVDRPARRVHVHDLVLDAFEPGEHPEASFLVTCSAGTYVRTIAHDVGQRLGVGASLVSLRRLANGPFTADEAHPLDAVVAADDPASLLTSVDDAIARSLPVVEVADATLVDRLAHGGSMAPGGHDGPFAVTHDGSLVGVWRDRGEVARPELVWSRTGERA